MKSIIKIATITSMGLLSALGFSELQKEKIIIKKTDLIQKSNSSDFVDSTSKQLVNVNNEKSIPKIFHLKKKVKDSTKLLYLLDTTGIIWDYAESDDFGNVDFTIKKPGTYRVAKMNGAKVIWSKRALFSDGINSIKIGTNGKESIHTMRNFSGSIAKRHLTLEDGAAPAPTSLSRVKDMSISHFADEIAIEDAETEETMVKTSEKIEVSTVSEEKTSKKSEKAKAGVMTAGIWNDLENWDRFNKTLQDEKIHANQWNWKMDNRRYAIEVTDKNGNPAIDIALQLRNEDGSIFWTAKTDNRGFAELWYAPYLTELKDLPHDFLLYAQYGERPFTKLGKVGSDGDVRNSFRINFEKSTPKNVDICFVVDATGSMGDEINYLKEELMELMLRSSEMTPCSDLRLSTVFYRDIRDAYTAIHAPFTSRFEDAVDFVQSQGAGGGGDYPEAVDAGLEEAIEKLEWSKNALTRLCFLVLDAPPHKEKKSEIERLTKEYAAQGIKIIPIAASGIDKPTEFLMKRMAAITSGDYIYITDHSGVGNSHIKPSGVTSDIDLLKNQLEKVIRKYTVNKECDKEPKPYNPDPQTIIFGNDQIVIQCFPNPATSFISINSNTKINNVLVYGINGQLIKKVESINTDMYRLDVRDIAKGMYILKANTDNQTFTTKILILNSQGID